MPGCHSKSNPGLQNNTPLVPSWLAARQCPDCKSDMQDDGVHAWCNQASCTFNGYVVVRTGEVINDPEQEANDHA